MINGNLDQFLDTGWFSEAFVSSFRTSSYGSCNNPFFNSFFIIGLYLSIPKSSTILVIRPPASF